MDAKKISNLTVYTLKLIDQTITPVEFEELNSILSSDAQAARYYNLLMMTVNNFQGSGREVIMDKSVTDCLLQEEFWKTLAEYEKNAPELEVPKEEAPELVQKVVYPHREKRKLSKFSILSLTINAAAILLLVLFLKFAPAKPVEVATLSDSMNAKWADIDASMSKGTRLVDNKKKLLLREGLVTLMFDNETKVVVEAPAEFQILAEDRIGLSYGRVYTTVPKEAIGFSVYTPNANVIDLGTEFGVEAETDGDVSLYVFKGKTSLIAGDKSNRASMEVTKGTAKRVSGITAEISDITCNKHLFARNFDSDTNVIWRGQTEINLAYLVDGGDGLTPGKTSSGIDLVTGDIHSEVVQDNRDGKTGYAAVAMRPSIDGVFVPNGTNVVSSANHTFTFPETNGNYFSDVTSNPYVLRVGTQNKVYPVYLNHNETEKASSLPMILLHPNAGITFDLNKIRHSLPSLEIDQFTATCGVSKSEDNIYRSEFWVLLDGVCVFHKLFDPNNSDVMEIDIPIAPDQGFLTLVTTDGDDEVNLDWCVFEEPKLHLASYHLPAP